MQPIRSRGVSEHGLEKSDVGLPRGSFAATGGLIGSGKSSLAFDTIHDDMRGPAARVRVPGPPRRRSC